MMFLLANKADYLVGDIHQYKRFILSFVAKFFILNPYFCTQNFQE